MVQIEKSLKAVLDQNEALSRMAAASPAGESGWSQQLSATINKAPVPRSEQGWTRRNSLEQSLGSLTTYASFDQETSSNGKDAGDDDGYDAGDNPAEWGKDAGEEPGFDAGDSPEDYLRSLDAGELPDPRDPRYQAPQPTRSNPAITGNLVEPNFTGIEPDGGFGGAMY